MSVTIKDVAKKANVSTATVSLVINNNRRISPSTRAKVLDAIKALNYHPSRSARGLVSNRTGNVGFILREDHFSKSEPFYTKVFLGTEFEAREHEYYVLLTTVPADFKKGDLLPRFVLERNVDAIIIAGKVPQELVTQLGEYPFPLIFVDYYPPGGNYPMVLIDNLEGGMAATRHLLDYGHRAIGFIGGDADHPSIADRLRGYKIALEKYGLPAEPQRIDITAPATDIPAGYAAATRLLQRAPEITAIFACNDAMAIGAMQYLKEQKKRVPDDISIVGFDDVDMCPLLDPPLTTVRVSKEELGIHSLRLCTEAIKSKSLKAHKVLIPVEVVVRESTRPVNQN